MLMFEKKDDLNPPDSCKRFEGLGTGAVQSSTNWCGFSYSQLCG